VRPRQSRNQRAYDRPCKQSSWLPAVPDASITRAIHTIITAHRDGLVLAYRVGAKLIFIDTMQYHPTVLPIPCRSSDSLFQRSQDARSQLTNCDGEQFVTRWKPAISSLGHHP